MVLQIVTASIDYLDSESEGVVFELVFFISSTKSLTVSSPSSNNPAPWSKI